MVDHSGKTIFVVLLLIFLCSGCSQQTATVNGQLTWKGKPLPSGTIIFHSADGTKHPSVLNEKGEYLVRNLPAGEARISFLPHERVPKGFNRVEPSGVPSLPGTKQAIPTIPKKYENAQESGLRLVAKPGSQRFDISLP